MALGTIFLLSPAFAQVAQMEKGTGVVSVDVPLYVELSSFKSPSGNTNGQGVIIKPVVSGGAFVARNVMVGAGFGILQGWNRYKTPSQAGKDQTPLYLMPSLIVRYYHMFTSKFGMYGQFSAEALLSVENNKNSKEYQINGLVSPRMVFFPKPFVGINVGVGELGYGFVLEQQQIPIGTVRTQQHNFMMLPTIHIGTSFFFGRAS